MEHDHNGATHPTGRLIIARHGETQWSRLGKHTGRTDVPLTHGGNEAALALGARLREFAPTAIYTSPLIRARDTALRAGFPSPIIDDRLAEWDYGSYEGVTSAEIHTTVPGWSIWTGDVPEGESHSEVALHADAFITEVLEREPHGTTLAFTHGHIGRMIAARWLGLEPIAGRLFAFDTAHFGVLGFERAQRAMHCWNV